ncbi:hypothetical protein SAMN04488109_2061 [Chryseolinea serpens]|uniref:Uncharacterized protein n=1 Tax=Chryseolinea serpens TaxID=947013 RepID=A0A1M5N265_9BACT|nr:hypothetical protein SAMN04488109_2061 [Chryseolinea serpens]
MPISRSAANVPAQVRLTQWVRNKGEALVAHDLRFCDGLKPRPKPVQLRPVADGQKQNVFIRTLIAALESLERFLSNTVNFAYVQFLAHQLQGAVEK